MDIFVSAGHNSEGNKIDPGAVANGYKESEINIEFRNLIISELKASGITVFQDKDNQTLSQYLATIPKNSNSLILEFHCDASINNQASGTTSIVPMNHNSYAKQLATQLVNKTSEVLQIKNRGVHLENQTYVKKLAILQKSQHSCLLELFFLTNKNDLQQYQKHKITLAQELGKLIINHINQFNINN